MDLQKTHIYFVPGLAAGKEIFRNIILPNHKYEMHIIEWKIPKSDETIQQYAATMAKEVTEPNSVLIGVSFGGVMAQEMSVFLTLKKLILISSVKTKYELPKRLRLIAKFRAYNALPASLIARATDFTKFAIGPRTKKRLQLYNEYLHVRNSIYLKWAVKQMVCWKRTHQVPDLIHLHGTHDAIFPIINISDAIEINGGTHVMVLTKGFEISGKIVALIENKTVNNSSS